VKTIKLLLIITLISSCGLDSNKRRDGDRPVNFSQSISAGGAPLSDQEKSIATRICYAFRSKRSTFRSELIGNVFNFKFNKTSCDGSKENDQYSTVLRQVLQSAPLVYDSDNSNHFYKNVQSDQHGHLQQICKSVLNGETPLDTFDYLGGIAQVRFFSKLGDNFEVVLARKKSALDSEYLPYQAERYTVLTSSGATGELLGLISKSKKYTPCAQGGLDNEVQEQNYVEDLN
jgi:hypothetical protein